MTFSIKGSIRQRMEYYPETGYLLSSTASDIQSFEYHYDVLGNMDHRYDHLHKVNGQSLHEQFYYDCRNQLTDTYLNGTLAGSITYDNLGNITSKSKRGGMEYQSGTSPYQLTGIVPDQNIDPGYKLSQNITYTDFNKVESITGNGYKLEIEYGLENQRISQSLSSVNQYGQTTLLFNKHFIGGLQEKIFYDTGAEKTISYITSPEGLTAIEVKSGITGEWYTVLTDHLGSFTTLVRESDGLRFELSYDAWGNRRNPATWVNYSGNLPDFITITHPDFITDRGFTGHEHLDMFGLINMNGRVYDPVASRFLSPDSFIQAPELALNYNGYVYCLNNPLKYTDPDGEFIFLAAILVGAAIGAYQGYKIGTAHGATGWAMAGYILGGATIGGVAGVASAGVGIAVGGAVAGAGLGGFAAGAITGAAAGATGGAINGFGMTALSGGTVGQAFAAAGMGALIGAGTGAVLGGTIQGIGAVKQGNNFWTGKEIASGRGAFSFNNTVRYEQLQRMEPLPAKVSTYNSGYQDPSEIKLPNKLSHYTDGNPDEWTTIGRYADETVYLTPDSELSSIGARNDLALPRTPNVRIDINTTSPNFNPDNIMIIRRVTGNVYGQGGGGWEVLYKGPIDIDKTTVIIKHIP